MKKLVFTVFTLIMALTLSVTAFAAAPDTKEKPDEMLIGLQEKFDGLSDVQKEQIYKQANKVYAQAEKLIKRYADFGVISQEDAGRLIGITEKMSQKAQEEGIMPFIPCPHPPASNAD